MTNFIEREAQCREAFSQIQKNSGPLWHICTPGEFTFSINTTEDDYKFSVSNMAISAVESGIVVISDQVMSNHIHMIGACQRACIQSFLESFRYREIKYLKKKGLYYNLDGFDCKDPIPIDTLQMLRREIVYCNRNGFLVDPSSTPFSYRWGGGSLYFNPLARANGGEPVEKLKYRVKRELSYRSAFEFPSSFVFDDGMILPISYVDYRKGESVFRNAHQYFSMISKDFEVFSEEARRYGDKVVVTDEEMYSVLMLMIRRDYPDTHPTLLPPSVKVEYARRLYLEYRASSQQIRRLLKLDMSDVEGIIGH